MAKAKTEQAENQALYPERIKLLEADLEVATKKLDELADQLKKSQEYSAQLEQELADLIVANKKLQEEAQKIRNAGGVPSANPSSKLPPEVEAILMASCVMVLRDRQSDGPLSEREFEINAPIFVDQAKRLMNMLLGQ